MTKYFLSCQPVTFSLGARAAAIFALTTTLSLYGCGPSPSAEAAAPTLPVVKVAIADSSEVTDWDSFTGRFEAVESVHLRPRVSGYIQEVAFNEGKTVQAGDLLFLIDPRPYALALDRAQAELARAKAQRELRRSELKRAERLLANNAISREEYDQRASQHLQSEAELQAAEADVATAALNLEYTRVVAPISGRVSRAQVTAGNYVAAGESVLTTLVSLDPIYILFEGDERSYLKYQALAARGERPSSRDAPNPVQVGLADSDDYPYLGHMDFVDNSLDPDTGTIRARAVIDNPEQHFTPGMLARIRLVGSGEYTAVLIDDSAVATNQNRKYVLVVDDDNVVQYREVDLGEMAGEQRVVRSGINAGEKIVVSGHQRVRPGMAVQTQLVTNGKTLALSSR